MKCLKGLLVLSLALGAGMWGQVDAQPEIKSVSMKKIGDKVVAGGDYFSLDDRSGQVKNKLVIEVDIGVFNALPDMEVFIGLAGKHTADGAIPQNEAATLTLLRTSTNGGTSISDLLGDANTGGDNQITLAPTGGDVVGGIITLGPGNGENAESNTNTFDIDGDGDDDDVPVLGIKVTRSSFNVSLTCTLTLASTSTSEFGDSPDDSIRAFAVVDMDADDSESLGDVRFSAFVLSPRDPSIKVRSIPENNGDLSIGERVARIIHSTANAGKTIAGFAAESAHTLSPDAVMRASAGINDTLEVEIGVASGSQTQIFVSKTLGVEVVVFPGHETAEQLFEVDATKLTPGNAIHFKQAIAEGDFGKTDLAATLDDPVMVRAQVRNLETGNPGVTPSGDDDNERTVIDPRGPAIAAAPDAVPPVEARDAEDDDLTLVEGSISTVRPALKTSPRPALQTSVVDAGDDTELSEAVSMANDGTRNDGISSDEDYYIQWNSTALLGKIDVTLASEAAANDTAIITADAGNTLTSSLLGSGIWRGLDITSLGDKPAEAKPVVTAAPETVPDGEGDSLYVGRAQVGGDASVALKLHKDGKEAGEARADADAKIGAGSYTVIFEAANPVGNTTTVTVPGVNFVPGAAKVTMYSPSEASINEETADPTIEVDRPLTAIRLYYDPAGSALGNFDDDINIIDIIAEELQNIDEPTEYRVPRDKDGDLLLNEGVTYNLKVQTRDDAGNRAIQTLESEASLEAELEVNKFKFDSDFDAATAASITIAVDKDEEGRESDHSHAPEDKKLVFSAGKEIDVRITVVSGGETPIPISRYGDDITVTVVHNEDLLAALGLEAEQSLLSEGAEGKGVTLTGDGVTDNGDGTFTIDGSELAGGTIRLTLKSERTAVFTLTASSTNSREGADPAELEGMSGEDEIFYLPDAFDNIAIWHVDDPEAGKIFELHLAAVDKFDNILWKQTPIVNLASNPLIQMPNNALLSNGVAQLSISSTRPVPNLVINAWIPKVGDAGGQTGDHQVVVVDPDAPPPIGEVPQPTDMIAYDYPDDDGGFIMITTALPDPLFSPMRTIVASLDGVSSMWSVTLEQSSASMSLRYWREVAVKYGVGDDGKLEENAHMEYIPWATVELPPSGTEPPAGMAAMSDDMNGNGNGNGEDVMSKQAFTSAEEMVGPYELMGQTMVESRRLAQLEPNTPLIATLTPEARTFITGGGIVPRMREGGAVVQSSAPVYLDEPVRAIDNIAPEAVSSLQAVDTPDDEGGSITISWTKSVSDFMMTRTLPTAVGPSTAANMVPGVRGYNIYRSIGDGEATLVDKVDPGETSFLDVDAAHGQLYTYTVGAFDEDNDSIADLSQTAMAIRNEVFDSEGVRIEGLFGADERVGYDDFFLFADHFMMWAGEEDYDPAFDLNADNKFDLADFFVFGDNFGRVAAGVSKGIPLPAGLNTDSRLDLYAGETLPQIGEEMVLNVNLADFEEIKGYGFTVNYNPDIFEFVKAMTEGNLLGTDLAQPQVLAQQDGEVSIAGYGETFSGEEFVIDLVFRPIAETEQSLIELIHGELSDGNFGLNQVASLGAVEIETRPEVYALRDNYPNPFNPETIIKYQLPEATDVRLEIFNVVGQLVSTLVAEPQKAGRYTIQWDSTNDSGQPLSSGIYFYRLQAGEFHKVDKMLLLK